MIELPTRPPASSRGMLVVATMVFVTLGGVVVFLNHAGAQKTESTSTQPTITTNMTTPTQNTEASPKPGEADLRKKLTPEQFRVTQMCGTEPPFRNEYWDNHRAGIYVDLVSGEPLFTSLDKFD